MFRYGGGTAEGPSPASTHEIFTEINLIDKHFGIVGDLAHVYEVSRRIQLIAQLHSHCLQATGIQVFWHQDHVAYMFLEPYIPDWGCCSIP